MKGRPTRMTSEQYDLLREQAVLRAKVMSYKVLAAKTGFSRTYCQQVVRRMMKGVQITVSHVPPYRECSTLGSGPLEPEQIL